MIAKEEQEWFRDWCDLFEGKELDQEKIVNFIALTVSKAEKAFGGCRACYGKGYSTVIVDGYRRAMPCFCDRGKQVERLFLNK